MAKSIPLYDRHGTVVAEAQVDDLDALWLGAFVWRLHRSARHRYAYFVRGFQGRGRTFRMHRMLLGLPAYGSAAEVDHINGDGLDNRRENIRVVTHAENMQNRPPQRGRYRGVWREGNRWVAGAKLNRRAHWLGTFDTEEEAAQVAAEWRAAHMPFATMR